MWLGLQFCGSSLGTGYLNKSGLVRCVLESCDTICLGPQCDSFVGWRPCQLWCKGYRSIDLLGIGTTLLGWDLVVSPVWHCELC